MNAIKETGLEVKAEQSKRVVMFRDQHAGKNSNIRGGDKSFERVEHFTYLGTTLIKLKAYLWRN